MKIKKNAISVSRGEGGVDKRQQLETFEVRNSVNFNHSWHLYTQFGECVYILLSASVSHTDLVSIHEYFIPFS